MDDVDEEMPEDLASAIGNALQSEHRKSDNGEDLLVAFVVVAEWMTPDGDRVLTRHAPEQVMAWQAKGYLTTAADFNDWPWLIPDDD